MSAKLAGENKQVFRDTLVSNLVGVVDLLDRFNITNDPKLEEARKQLELTMLGANMESIKEDAECRKELKSKVDAIINKFNF